MPFLVCLDGADMGTAFPLRGTVSAGRSPGNAIVLEDPSVLDRHADLLEGEDGVRVAPAAPGAPIRVNGGPLPSDPIRPGDILGLGDVALLLAAEVPRPPRGAPAPPAGPLSLDDLSEAAARLHAPLRRDLAVEEAVHQAGRLLGGARISLFLSSRDGDHLVLAGSNCIASALHDAARIPPGEGRVGRVFRSGRPETGERFLALPVLAPGGGPEAGGVLFAARPAPPFGSRDRDLLSFLAGQAAVALGNAELFERVATDPLTGLPGRPYFEARLEEEVRAHRSSGRPLAILLGDLDHLGDRNDIYGRGAGDALLAEAASIFRRAVEPRGFAARLGGGEFGAILPDTPAGRAVDLARDLRRSVEEHPFRAGDETLHCTISFGVAAAAPGDAPAELLRKAGAALREAKRRGRNRVETFEGNL